MIDYIKFGKRVKENRVKRHMTAEQFSESVGISVSFLREIERGNKKPNIENFVKIVNALGVSSDDLLCDSIDNDKPLVLNKVTEKMKSMSSEQVGLVEALVDTIIREVGRMG